MNRWYIAPIMAIALALLWVASASADGGPHGGYTQLTYRCAGCHRAHTAEGSHLLKETSALALCSSCHHTTGSSSDELNGLAYSSGTIRGPLRAGGFMNAMMNTNLAATAPTTYTATTSVHRVNGLPGYTPGMLWGFGTSGAGTSFSLECSTCHDPHGASGRTTVNAQGNYDPNGTLAVTETYRILRGDIGSKVDPAAGVTPVYVLQLAAGKDSVQKYISPTLTNDVYYGVTYDQVLRDGTILGNQLNGWCAQCHTRIHTNAVVDPATTNSNDPFYAFRHPTNGNAVTDRFTLNISFPSNPQTTDQPGCMTCHVSHGATSVLGSTSADYQVARPDGTGNLDMSLLRLDGRGVCETCHNKGRYGALSTP
jgi:predicted CXXCH cytochrome family protein